MDERDGPLAGRPSAIGPTDYGSAEHQGLRTSHGGRVADRAPRRITDCSQPALCECAALRPPSNKRAIR